MTKTKQPHLTAGTPHIDRHGILLILSSPSGAGKTTIAKALMDIDSQLCLSISVTTRKPRGNEVDGKDYHFISHEKFDDYIRRDLLIEHATVFGEKYGTLREPIEKHLESGKDVLFDIDWQGAGLIRETSLGASVVSIFILPPSMDELESRLRKRKQDAPEVRTQRMKGALREITHYSEYDYVIINQDIQASIATATKIVQVERLRRFRQTGLAHFVKGFDDFAS